MDRPDLARAQLQVLDEELTQRRVAEWDVALLVDVVRSEIDCEKRWAEQTGTTTAERLQSLHERLSRIDPAAALGVEPLLR